MIQDILVCIPQPQRYTRTSQALPAGLGCAYYIVRFSDLECYPQGRSLNLATPSTLVKPIGRRSCSR